MSLTKAQFMRDYRAALLTHYEWAQDPARLAKFMASVHRTIYTEATTANLTGSPLALLVWRAAGEKGRPTYKALRALPEGEG